jgi:SfnB family sulfur acquisition oxidoreductase
MRSLDVPTSTHSAGPRSNMPERPPEDPAGTAPVSVGVIGDDAQALDSARRIAEDLAVGAADRDRERRLPDSELELLSATGLLGLTVPRRFGGADVRITTLVEVFRLLAEADASLSQIPHSHFVFLEVLRLQGNDRQQEHFFAEALAGRRFANAQSERNGSSIQEDATTLVRKDRDSYVLTGEKFYTTGALFADWLAVRATLPGAPRLPSGQPRKAVAYVPRHAPGVTVVDDWDGMGQRTTASGTVRLDHVPVPDDHVVPFSELFDRPTVYGAQAQVLHAAIDVGIARAAMREAVLQVGRARPWFEAGTDRAADDPLLLQDAGELEIAIRGAEALLREAAGHIDETRQAPTDEGVATASIATAVAKVACARIATEAASNLFELAGTRSAADSLNLSRYWRDARTHTLHDPSRWKVQHIGRWVLSGVPPPRHGLL